ncbi:hypothetical protein L7F22_005509 [Adiantum nelumboides]|nr:hypothetical protein [Adiantum nelumboides]
MSGVSAGTHSRKDYRGSQNRDNDEPNREHRVASSVGPSHKALRTGNASQAITEFVADFENASIFNPESKDMVAESVHRELESLRAELKQVKKEILEISTKCEKLTSLCGSQQLEIQQLKSTVATANSQLDSVQSKEPVSQKQRSSQEQERAGGAIWDVDDSSSSPGLSANETHEWKAFSSNVPKVWSLNESDKLKTSPNNPSGGPHFSNHSQPAGWSEF